MAKARASKSKSDNKAPALSDEVRWRLREVLVLLLLPLAIYLLACLLSYNPADPGWSHAGNAEVIHNFGGRIGAWCADFLLYLFGMVAYAFPVLLAILGFRVLRWSRVQGRSQAAPSRSALEPALRLVGFVGFFIAGTGLAQLHVADSGAMPARAGGVLGQVIGGVVSAGVGYMGATLFLLALFLVALTLAVGVSWFRIMDWLGRGVLQISAWCGGQLKQAPTRLSARAARSAREKTRKADQRRRKHLKQPEIHVQPELEKPSTSKRATREQQIPLFTGASSKGELPPLSLLDKPPAQRPSYSQDTLETLSRQVELKLRDFRIEVKVVGVYPGPVITRFELEPAPGVRGAQVSKLDKDIARGLSVVSVRVVDVIPGKNVIGLEIPNAQRQTVFLSEVLRSDKYDQARSALTLALGKDIGGRPIVADLAKMPHLLVAGTTGSGKSVAVNAMILSLLYKASPADVRLIMIDPKMLELSVYEGIPQLLAPVVTDMKEAANALRWCVAEMERRYKLMATTGVRNLAGFNRKVREAGKSGQPLLDPLFTADPDNPELTAEPLEPLPAIVVIIDEFADMMMIVGKKVEELIARLAQKARAAGIHLILATQRPSVDVITGLIKANVPTRIAFQVSSRVDSRTILDQTGAQSLLGNGDMLFLPPGTATPERVHGAFVDDHEVHQVVEWLKAQGEPDYIEGVLEEVQTMGDGRVISDTGIPRDSDGDDGGDVAMYDKAVAIVTQTRRASISSVQRHLRIGYNRAARLVEQMEADGVVSAPQHNGSREVLAPPPPRD